MAIGQEYDFKTADGDLFIPIANGVHLSEVMNRLEFDFGEVFVAIYQADKVTLATGTGGTIAVRGRGKFDGQWLTPSGVTGVINVTEIQAGNADYDLVSFNSTLEQVQLTFAGITGGNAAFVRAYVFRKGTS